MTFTLLLLAALGAAEKDAVAFLAREVPAWPAENRCYSCHNNGDAARALFSAVDRGHDVPEASMADTLAWLRAPGAWGDQKGEEAFSDETLTRIQFASALADAIDAGLIEDRDALLDAARLVAGDQHDDGSWHLDASASIGSPATYGRFLATATAHRVLTAAGREHFAGELDRAGRFLRETEVKTVVDAAAVLIALSDAGDAYALRQQGLCHGLIEEGEAPTGGWGPYVTSAPEPFDTALVLLALVRYGGNEELIERGRRYLLEQQLDDGSWRETTRPAGQLSYAQYISTTGWALLALLATSR
jgi:hypothetical protein